MRLFTSQSPIEDFDGTSDELPASCTYTLALTARSDFIVVGHINIKNELALDRLQSLLELQPLVLRSSVIYCPDFETRRIQADDFAVKVNVRGERIVALDKSDFSIR